MVHCKQVCWRLTRSSSQHLHARSAHFFGGPIYTSLEATAAAIGHRLQPLLPHITVATHTRYTERLLCAAHEHMLLHPVGLGRDRREPVEHAEGRGGAGALRVSKASSRRTWFWTCVMNFSSSPRALSKPAVFSCAMYCWMKRVESKSGCASRSASASLSTSMRPVRANTRRSELVSAKLESSRGSAVCSALRFRPRSLPSRSSPDGEPHSTLRNLHSMCLGNIGSAMAPEGMLCYDIACQTSMQSSSDSACVGVDYCSWACAHWRFFCPLLLALLLCCRGLSPSLPFCGCL